MATGILGWVTVFFFVPELKGRSYEELDELFERRIPTRRFASTQTEAQRVREPAAAGTV